MNTFQNCRHTSDAIPLYLPQYLYLKPFARLNISVQLPNEIEPGKNISNWEIMEKLRVLIKPIEFSVLKATKNTLQFVRFEAEIEDKSQLFRIIALLDARTIKLNSFPQNVKIRASEAKSEFPTRHTWDSYFRDAKNMDEMKPGERPDTIHISNLPIKWFVQEQHINKEGVKPSQKIFQRMFEKFGQIRHVDIPICDPYRSKMKEHINGMKTFTFEQDVLFEGYVQFKDYIGFTRAMDTFKGMKLLRKAGSEEPQTVNIIVDFDKTKHLSDPVVRRRQIVRERMIEKDRDREEKDREETAKTNHQEEEKRKCEIEQKEEKERKRREREERRKARYFAQMKLKETEELKKKIIKEEKKLLKAQRKLEAIRLIEDLFKRINLKKANDAAVKNKINKHTKDELSKFKVAKELKVKLQREKLNKALEGRVVLNSILGDDKQKYSSSASSSDSESEGDKKHKKKKKKDKKKKKSSKSSKEKTSKVIAPNPFAPQYSLPYPGEHYDPLGQDMNWMIPHQMGLSHPMYRPMMPRGRGMMSLPGQIVPRMTLEYLLPHMMPRGRNMMGLPGPSRGFPRRRGYFNPYRGRGWGRGMPQNMEFHQHNVYEDDRDRRSYSRSRSRSRSGSYDRRRSKRSYSRSRTRTRSRTRSRSRNRSRSRSHSRSKSKSRSKSRSRSKNRSRSKSRSKTKSSKAKSKRSKSRSKSRSRSRSKLKEKDKDKSKNKENKNGTDKSSKKSRRSKSRSASYQSIDSSKFISPSMLRSKRSRSKSWSLPRNSKNKKRSSWSKSPSPKV